jgi:hypothetical protein
MPDPRSLISNRPNWDANSDSFQWRPERPSLANNRKSRRAILIIKRHRTLTDRYRWWEPSTASYADILKVAVETND